MTPVYSRAVKIAKATGKPLVALESTIITHGMPWPQNVETARAVEAVVREEGAEPATMAVLDGALHAGLEPEQDLLPACRPSFPAQCASLHGQRPLARCRGGLAP